MTSKLKRTDRDHLSYDFRTDSPTSPIEWKISDGLVEYPEALCYMQKRVENISAKIAHEQVWLLEHPPFIQLVQVPTKRTF